jgi:peptide/nickel transport system permease protein
METKEAGHRSVAEGMEFKPQSWSSIVARQLVRNKGAMVGLAGVMILILVALLASIIAPYDPTAQSRDSMEPPSLSHLMGTDRFGRDLFSRVVFGTRISLRIGFIAVGIGASIGLVLGLIGGYYGGNIDRALVMLTDAMLAFPGILLAMTIVSVLGTGLTNVMIAVGISSVPGYIRLVRGSVLSAREQVYVESAQAVGCSDLRILFRHILPNVLAPAVVLATLAIPVTILSAAGLSFLGLGAQPPTPEWGIMVSEGRQFLRSGWWIATFPGLVIMMTVLSVNLFGDGLRDAIDPRMRLR